MTPERWQQVKAVLAGALECAPADRAALLEKVCGGDRSLRAEVESLLACEGPGGGVLDTARPGLRGQVAALYGLATGETGAAGAPAAPAAEAGSHIGPYRVIRELARGGMGAVYLAERSDQQYRREVAVKLIRRGMDTDFVLRRFRSERQILAAFDHPNIARLLDGGTTADGLPYFVMEYVEGEPLDAYCDRRALDTEARLALFLQVCAAVQYAHQRMVVHRDIKPSNILVAADGTPKLLDFGIAKLLTPDLAGQTLDPTASALRLMTPAYASPEQIKGEPVTTATDVYSLGVLLYELLTGHRPYRVRRTATHELLQAVLTEEPTRPSAAVALTEAVQGSESSAPVTVPPEAVCAARGSSPFRLRRRLRGDLDNIVLTALRKDPQRRYASVQQFAEDIRRHLLGRPVAARSDTLWYRAAKFTRRNKLGVAAAGLVLATLVGGVVGVNQQRQRAERRFDDVRKLARAVVFDYHDAIADLPGSTPVRQRLVKDALEYLDSLAGEASDDLTLQRELAAAYGKVGDVQGNSNLPNLGDTTGALDSYHKSLAIRQALARAAPADSGLRAELSESYERVGDILRTLGQVGAADLNYREAIRLLEGLASSAPQDPARRRLAGLLYRVGNLKGYGRTANLGDTRGAIEYHRRALALREDLCAAAPSDLSLRLDLQESHRSLANLLVAAANDVAGGESHALRAVELAQSLVDADRTNARALRALVEAQDALARALSKKGELGEAAKVCRRSLEMAEAVLAADPKNMQARQDLASGHTLAGNIYLRKGEMAEGLRHYRRALALSRAISADDPNNDSAKRWVAQDQMGVGRALSQAGDLKGALGSFRQALAILQPLYEKNPHDVPTRLLMARVYDRLGQTLTRLGDLPAALRDFRRSAELHEHILAQDTANEAMRRNLALLYSHTGDACWTLAARAATPAERSELLREARDTLARSLALLNELRGKAAPLPEDGYKEGQVRRKLDACYAALATLP